jgi:hypothetical protein
MSQDPFVEQIDGLALEIECQVENHEGAVSSPDRRGTNLHKIRDTVCLALAGCATLAPIRPRQFTKAM